MQGIKFNEHGIKGILNGSKTMTRRPIKEQLVKPSEDHYFDCYNKSNQWNWWDKDGRQNLSQIIQCKYKVGEVLFVQEPFLGINYLAWIYKYDNKHTTFEGGMRIPWCSANEMPHYASRIKIKITGIKVERLQDISEEDCIKEGIKICIGAASDDNLMYLGQGDFMTHQEVFKEYIWDKLPYQQPYDWDSNPYVFVYEFEVIK